jgi:thymidylate synthase
MGSIDRVVKDVDLKKTWFKLMRLVYEYGTETVNTSGKKSKEFLNVITSILSPFKDLHLPDLPNEIKKELSEKGWELLPQALIRPDVAEWFLPARRLNWKIRSKTVNQIEELVIKPLKRNPYTRRAIVTTVNPLDDSRGEVHLDPTYPFPAILSINFKFYEEKLHLIGYFRSCEVYFWWPVNMTQFAYLLEYVAKTCGFEIGTVTAMISCAHIREENFKKVEELIKMNI